MFHFLPDRRKKTDQKSGKEGGILFKVTTTTASPTELPSATESTDDVDVTTKEQSSSTGVALVVEARRDAEGQAISKAFTERKVHG